ncbi:hypothetical protein [Erythrobacter sp.]|uniref:hypothetical protein n=1 Tax=Erythrobacter sp. TaxID=1042 RepID=UPI001426013D|nr:hypothetical protein [Erythrobacter sp.]QIQ87172.1 MAG: hypothetical protein G9473_11115 [Erythrobacter sp.]
MRRLMQFGLAMLAAAMGLPANAEEPGPRATLERAIAAHGGEVWLTPTTLALSGEAVFYDRETGAVRSRAEDYRMWRAFDPDRASAHEASGKVRIVAKSGERVLFEIGYDGETTWTERGIMPKAQADEYWANNFGFGVVRQALGEGFTLHRAPSRDILGRETRLVRIADPEGAETLFGFDKESGFITYLAFDTPRGFHERLYADFVKLPGGWVQAREVTLLYDGIKSNTVLWTETSVDEPLDEALFTPPSG